MNASPLCALATVSPGGRAHINHMYFARSGLYDVVWISAGLVLIGTEDRGIQLFGTAGLASGMAAREAERAYAARFPPYDASDSYPIYRFRPREVKLFYERLLGGGTLVTARVTRDGLTWLRTEVCA